jgi:ribose 5-phosphate isomerase A
VPAVEFFRIPMVHSWQISAVKDKGICPLVGVRKPVEPPPVYLSLMATVDARKLAAAEAAATLVEDGMTVGLGSGSTASLAVAAVGRRVAQGLRIVAIPTSEATAAQARKLGIPLTTLDDRRHIDLTIDGADEVERGSLDLVKGLGGALLREKIVASATARLVIVADESKLVDHLGAGGLPIPVEVVPFGWQTTARRLSALGAEWTQRLASDGQPFVTDGGHLILDCRFQRLNSARELQQRLDEMVGVVEHGLFLGMASEVIVGRSTGEVLNLRPA